MKQFRIVYTIDVTLTEVDIWPDGDAPTNPTAGDVGQKLSTGNLHSNMYEWNLTDEAELDVLEVDL